MGAIGSFIQGSLTSESGQLSLFLSDSVVHSIWPTNTLPSSPALELSKARLPFFLSHVTPS